MSSNLSEVLADILPAQESAPQSQPDAKPQAEQPEGQTQETKVGADEPETADEAQTDETGDESEPEQPRKKPGSAKWREKAERLERELAQLRPKAAAAADDKQALAKAVEERIGPPPKRDEFDSFLDYDVARTAYEVDKRQATREVQRTAESAQQAELGRVRELLEGFEEQAAEARKLIPDFDQVQKSAVPIENRAALEAILESDKAALLADYFGRRPDAVERLNRMPPFAAAKEIGRVEARLSAPKPKTATKAPPPVSPPSGGAKAPDPMDIESDPSWKAFASKRYGAGK